MPRDAQRPPRQLQRPVPVLRAAAQRMLPHGVVSHGLLCHADFHSAAMQTYLPLLTVKSSIALPFHIASSIVEFSLAAVLVVGYIGNSVPFLFVYITMVALWAATLLAVAIAQAAGELPQGKVIASLQDAIAFVAYCVVSALYTYFAFVASRLQRFVEEMRRELDLELLEFVEDLAVQRRRRRMSTPHVGVDGGIPHVRSSTSRRSMELRPHVLTMTNTTIRGSDSYSENSESEDDDVGAFRKSEMAQIQERRQEVGSITEIPISKSLAKSRTLHSIRLVDSQKGQFKLKMFTNELTEIAENLNRISSNRDLPRRTERTEDEEPPGKLQDYRKRVKLPALSTDVPSSAQEPAPQKVPSSPVAEKAVESHTPPTSPKTEEEQKGERETEEESAKSLQPREDYTQSSMQTTRSLFDQPVLYKGALSSEHGVSTSQSSSASDESLENRGSSSSRQATSSDSSFLPELKSSQKLISHSPSAPEPKILQKTVPGSSSHPEPKGSQEHVSDVVTRPDDSSSSLGPVSDSPSDSLTASADQHSPSTQEAISKEGSLYVDPTSSPHRIAASSSQKPPSTRRVASKDSTSSTHEATRNSPPVPDTSTSQQLATEQLPGATASNATSRRVVSKQDSHASTLLEEQRIPSSLVPSMRPFHGTAGEAVPTTTAATVDERTLPETPIQHRPEESQIPARAERHSSRTSDESTSLSSNTSNFTESIISLFGLGSSSTNGSSSESHSSGPPTHAQAPSPDARPAPPPP